MNTVCANGFLKLGPCDFCCLSTHGPMNSLFSDLFGEFWRGNFRGVRDYLGEILGGFRGKMKRTWRRTILDKKKENMNNPIE